MPGDAVVEPGGGIRHRLPPLPALTSLRFFAATYVAVYHLAAGHSLARIVVVENFISSGDTGVSLFFILSGFILAYNYRTIDHPQEFWISRFARIYPVYLFALMLSVVYSFAPASPPASHPWLRFWLTATLLQSWHQSFADSYNSPGWTLSVEAFFYALFPLALRGIAQAGRRRFEAFCAVYFACLCVPAGLLAFGRGDQAAELAEFLTGSRSPVLHLPLFLIGAWLGFTYGAKQHFGALRQRAGLHLFPCLAAAGCMALLGAGPSGVYEPARRGLLVLGYAALIWGLAEVRAGVLTSHSMVLAGEISFSIYILQMPVFRSVFGATRHMHPGPYTSVALALSILVAVSYFAHRFIELPARVAIRRYLTHRPVPLIKLEQEETRPPRR